MRLLPLLTLCFGVSLMACVQAQSEPQSSTLSATAALARIDSLERAMFPDGRTDVVDTGRAHRYVREIIRFAEAEKTHPRTPELLMQAAGIANGSQWGNKAIELWGFVWRRYPDFERAPLALFYQGFFMDTQYGDYPLATQYYSRFLKHFPDHELVDQVKQLRAVAQKGGAIPPVPAPPGN